MKRVSKINIGKFMDTDVVEKNFIISSLYLSSFEILKICIIEDTKSFFSKIDGKKLVITEEYNEEVQKLDKFILKASCLWLEKMGAITNEEIDKIDEIRKHRNEIAHELPRLLIDNNLDVNINLLFKIKELIEKIDIFWIDIEKSIQCIETNDEEEIKTGRMMIIDHLFSAVF